MLQVHLECLLLREVINYHRIIFQLLIFNVGPPVAAPSEESSSGDSILPPEAKAPPRLNLLSSIQGAGLKSLKKVSQDESSDGGGSGSGASSAPAPPAPPAGNPMFAAIAGGKSVLKSVDAPKPPEKSGGGMMDAINAQKSKVSYGYARIVSSSW